MDKKLLYGISLYAVVLLVLGSISNVVGYQTVQQSKQKIINEEIDQREQLFQTIVDTANNKEIQQIVLKYQMSRGKFPASNIPFLTKTQLRQMYLFSLILSKFINNSRIQSTDEAFQFSIQEMKNEIKTVIQRDASLNSEITQLFNTECECGNESTTRWSYPVMCSILDFMFFSLSFIFVYFYGVISDGRFRDKPILEFMAVVIWIKTGALLTTVDSLFNIYCKTGVLAV